MKKKKFSIDIKLWVRRFFLTLLFVFLYWGNEELKIFSIHNPTCLLIILSFFIIISLGDILILKLLKFIR